MSCGRCSSPVNRTVIVFALFLGAITGAIGSAQAAGQAGSENFPVALRLLPRRYRHDLAAI